MPLDPDKQLGGRPGSVNEEFFNAMIRHQIGLLRVSGSIRNEIYRILDSTETDIADKITRRLAGHKGIDSPQTVQRLSSLLTAIRETRLRAWREITPLWLQRIREVAAMEPQFTDTALKTVAPVQLETVLPPTRLLHSLVASRPFEGRVLRDWAADVRRADLRRIEDQIRIGLVQGEPSQVIARRVVGSARQRGRNGVTEITRRNAMAITRTAVNHISNQARREYLMENKALFREEMFVATLDNRTTFICMSLDGTRFPVGEGEIPPVHMLCRSLRVAVVSEEALGSRPAKPVTERQLLREFSERRGIQAPGRRADLPRGTKGAFDDYSRTRIRELTGTVPSKVSYQEWLSTQSNMFQRDVLGPTRAKLFRDGGLRLDRFVDRAGTELPLSQLARVHAAAFRAAGLDPTDFL